MNDINHYHKVNIKFCITDKDIKEEVINKLNNKILGNKINKDSICCQINSVDKFVTGTILNTGEVNFIVECNIKIFKPIKDKIYSGIITQIISDCIIVQINDYLEITIIGNSKDLKYKIGEQLNNIKLMNFKFIEKNKKFVGRGIIEI